jgi:CsoR family transcriptional regulator, copper-sensing transcriptional repressor
MPTVWTGLGTRPASRLRYTMPGYGSFFVRADARRRLEDGMHGYSQNKDDYLARLRRIEGQVRGLQRMVEEDKYCIDILTQVSAVTRALQSVALGLLDEHMGHCVTQAVAEGGDTAAAKIREASDAIARLVRS